MGRLPSSRWGEARDMSPETYKLRRAVMKLIYDAKALHGGSMARVELRITDLSEEGEKRHILGSALMGKRIVYIPASTVVDAKLRQVVYHELLHALYGVEHDESCPLMTSCFAYDMSREEADGLFRKYIGA